MEWNDDGAGPIGRPAANSLFHATADNLEIRGPLLSIGADWPLTDHWRLGGLVFYDTFELRTDGERRDLQTDFAPSTPIARPVSAEFTNLDGTARDYGGGIYAALQSSGGMLGAHRWIGGVLWHQVVLEDYRLDYRVLEGPDAGATGQLDFDTSYEYVVPFIGFEMPRHYGRWSADAHVLLAYPLRKRSVVGHITGPGFDIHGDTETAGNGVHFGDPSLTLGYTVSYEPLHLSVDLGTLVTQYLLEPRINRGIERNLLLSFSLGF